MLLQSTIFPAKLISLMGLLNGCDLLGGHLASGPEHVVRLTCLRSQP